MPPPKKPEEAYEACLRKGYLKNKDQVNTERIISLAENAETHCNSAEILAKGLGQDAKGWIDVFTLYYQTLHTYAEALLLFEKMQSDNHQCLLAAVCIKFPALELEWDFLERIRTKRNGINYYGEQITYQDWKSVKIQLKLYIATLKGEIKKRLA